MYCTPSEHYVASYRLQLHKRNSNFMPYLIYKKESRLTSSGVLTIVVVIIIIIIIIIT